MNGVLLLLCLAQSQTLPRARDYAQPMLLPRARDYADKPVTVPVAPKPDKIEPLEVAPEQIPEEKPAVVAKSCSCSPQCECGCNEGKPCACGAMIAESVAPPIRFFRSSSAGRCST